MQSQCTDCTPGYFCDGSNLTEPSGPCAPGYYCTSGKCFMINYLYLYFLHGQHAVQYITIPYGSRRKRSYTS